MLAVLDSGGGLANLVVLLTTLKVLADFLAARLRTEQQEKLMSLLKSWQARLESESTHWVCAAPLRILYRGYGRLLGPKPFSRAAMKRTFVMAALVLGASLGITGLLCGKPLAMNMLPWDSFSASMGYLRELSQSRDLVKGGDSLFVAQNSADLARFDKPFFAMLFTVYFAAMVVSVTALLVSLSTAVSRVFLREMILARTGFRMGILLFSNTAILLTFAAAASFFLFVTLNIWTWPLVPLLSVVSRLSVLAGLGMASAASLGSWFFSAPWLRVVVVMSVMPSVLVAIAFGIRLVVFPFRRRLSLLLANQLRRAVESPKGVFSFVSSSAAALALSLTFLIGGLSWLSRLKLSEYGGSIFGLNSFGLSIFAFALMVLLALMRAANSANRISISESLFLFLLSFITIIAGFYVQAIMECLFNVGSAGDRADKVRVLVQPVVGALLPAAVVGYIVVSAFCMGARPVRVALNIFAVLAGWDVFVGLYTPLAFRDTAFSILCDAVGAPIAALIILSTRSLFFRSQLTHENLPASSAR